MQFRSKRFAGVLDEGLDSHIELGILETCGESRKDRTMIALEKAITGKLW
jgi:hypothetical protein